MAYQKLQTYRALTVFKTDAIDAYPDPSRLADSGSTTSTTANKLVDSGATFRTGSIKIEPGYIVENSTDGSYAIVKRVDSDTTLSLSVDIFTANPKSYKIYAGVSSDPCIIFVGTAGVVDVTSADDNVVAFANIGNATFLPLQIKKVNADSTASNFIAMW